MNNSIKDGIHLLSLLTWKRFANAIKVLAGYYVSRVFHKPFVWGMPLSIEIEPTTSCNLRCPQCVSGTRSFTRETGMLQLENYFKVIDEIYPELIWLILYFQGEPYLHKQFLKMVTYASQKKIYVATSTNGHYLNDETARATVESGLSRMIISIDGTNQESYEKYRIGGDFEKVIQGTKNILEWKRKLNSSTPHIIWQFIVFKHNEHEIPAIQQLAKELGVNELGIKTAQIYDYKKDNSLIPVNEKFSRYAKENDSYEIKNKFLNHCWRIWRSTVITWDGWVVPCCFDKDASHKIGNVWKDSFRTVWINKKYSAFRKSILSSRKEIDICTNCTEGTQVWN